MSEGIKTMKRIGAIIIFLVLLLVCCSTLAEENTTASSEDEGTPIVIDGDTMLKIRLDFRDEDNRFQYDVDIYLDGNYIITVPHGELYKGTLMVSEGEHTIAFCRAGEYEVTDEYTFVMEGPMILRCEIKAVDNKVELSDF